MSSRSPVEAQTAKIVAEVDKLVEMKLVLAFLAEAGEDGLTRRQLQRLLTAHGQPPKGTNPLYHLLEETLHAQVSSGYVTGGTKCYWLTQPSSG